MITEVTRRAIFDRISAGGYDWAGRLQEEDFLSRLYDLTALPSHDHRLRTAAGDIAQHRSHFRDWADDWVFYDGRFNLLRCSDEELLRFLAETVHPVVRESQEQVAELVAMYNEQLGVDGWEIFSHEQISGRPVFQARRADVHVEIFVEPTGWPRVDRQMDEIRLACEKPRRKSNFRQWGIFVGKC